MPIQKITTGVIDGTTTFANTAISGTITASQIATVNASTVTTGTLPSARLGSDVMVAGNMPAFSAYMTTNQTLAYNSATKLVFNAEEFDTASCFDTNAYRFTPTVAGYYQINSSMFWAGTATRNYYVGNYIYKNGSNIRATIQSFILGAGTDVVIVVTGLIYMNGSTDYLESYGYQVDYTASGTITVLNNSAYTTFNGSLVRAA
jgi:hypothetical protein